MEISVIIPFHNCENYIKQCMDSVLGQSFSDFEVICVDDCSTDATAEILREYQKQDSRVRVITNTVLQMAGGSRNIGLDAAAGEYVVFWDGDDFFETDALEDAYRQITRYHADMAVFYYDVFDESSQSFLEWDVRRYSNPYLLKGYPVIDRPIEQPYCFQTVHFAPWTKMIRRELLIRSGVRFMECGNVEDLPFSLCAAAVAERIVFLDRKLIHYRRRAEGSLTNQSYVRKCYIVEACMKVWEYLEGRGLLNSAEKSLANEIVRSVGYYFYQKDVQAEVTRDIRRVFGEFYHQRLESRNWDKEIFFNLVIHETYQYLIGESNTLPEWQWLRGCTNYKAVDTYIKEQNWRTALWGAGDYGNQFLRAYQAAGYDVDEVVDRDTAKQGTLFWGHRIVPYEEICGEIDAVIVTNPYRLEEIKKSVRTGQSVINIQIIAEYGCEVRAEAPV